MSTSQPPVERRSGLANVVDIIIAPSAAFDRIRQVPVWGWAFLVAVLLGIAGSLLLAPAFLHAMETSMPAQLAAGDAMSKLSPEQQQKQIAVVMSFSRAFAKFYWLAVPPSILLIGLVQAVIMLVANAATRGDGTFKKYYALSITITVVGTGLSSLVLGIIALVRGANSFETTASVSSALPSLALLAPGAKGALGGFLGSLNVFYFWSTALLALGMNRVGRIPGGVAWATAILMLLVTACFAAFGARSNV